MYLKKKQVFSVIYTIFNPNLIFKLIKIKLTVKYKFKKKKLLKNKVEIVKMGLTQVDNRQLYFVLLCFNCYLETINMHSAAAGKG